MARKSKPAGRKEQTDWRGRAVLALPFVLGMVFAGRVVQQLYNLIAESFRLHTYADPEEAEVQVWVPVLAGVLFLTCGVIVMVLGSRAAEALPRLRSWVRCAALAIGIGAVVGLCAFWDIASLLGKWVTVRPTLLTAGILALAQAATTLVAAAPFIRPERATTPTASKPND